MRSTFGGLESGLRALRAQQLALELTGHNIANADTEGYSRQVAVLTASDPYTVPTMNRLTFAGQIGTGVEVSRIRRMRDEFLDRQIQYENSALGRWEARQSGLEQLEVIFQEPSDTGLAAQLNEFWGNLQEMADRPDDIAVRSTVLESGKTLAQNINHIYNQLLNYQKDVDKQIRILVGNVNNLASQIAELNKEIGRVTAVGQDPNDLLDKREVLVQELAKTVNISVQTGEANKLTISVGGALLVAGDTAFSLKTVNDADGFAKIVSAVNGQPVEVRSGELKGFQELRDVELKYYLDSLNDFASTLITRFNTVHSSGFGRDGSTGNIFFSGTDASNIGINPALANLELIAASTVNGAEGNGENAINLANVINDELLMSGGTATLSDFFDAVIAKLGVDAEKTETFLDNQKSLVAHLKNRQESVAGVSLDEEMANMIKFQNSYNAAARIISTIDEILDKLINGTGVVGR